MRTVIAVLLTAISASTTYATGPSESDLRTKLCAGMEQEVALPNGTRADCVTDRLAIEVDWTHKWAEAIGQSMLYSAVTNKLPGIILICKVRDDQCQKHEYLINESVAHWKLPITVWLCGLDDDTLAACSRRDY